MHGEGTLPINGGVKGTLFAPRGSWGVLDTLTSSVFNTMRSFKEWISEFIRWSCKERTK